MSITVPPVAPTPNTYTPATQFGAALMIAMNPWLTLHMAWVLDAVGACFDPVYTLALDVGDDDGTEPTIGTYVDGELVTEGYSPGYGQVFDPSRATLGQLAYLGQFVGAQVPIGADQTTARSYVLEEAGLSRGTNGAIIAAARRNLSGTQSVALLERTYVDGTADAGWFLLIVRPEEVIDEQALIASVTAVKFDGLMWALIQQDAPLLSQYTRLLSEVTVPLDAATLADVT